MAYVNVAEWSPDQVGEWLKGLDDVIEPYIHYFVEKKVNGKRLLHLAPIDFPGLNVTCIGHQAIILQGLELLRNIHYHLDQENLQYLALRLSSTARSVYNELRQLNTVEVSNGVLGHDDHDDKDPKDNGKPGQQCPSPKSNYQKKEKVSTRILSGVVDVLSSVKSLVSWLHRSPFSGVEEYDNLKSSLVDLSIGLATIAQREFAFAENPASVIRDRCFTLAEVADKIVQEYRDPLILQPASLDVVTIKKRTDDNWGLSLVSSYHGIHQISMIRALSPAHTCGKLMGDDQLVQVNYQTIVGWTSHKVTQLMQENPGEVILTVKKCPRHDTNNLAKIYFKPIRLPSKKRIYSSWASKVLSPTKYDLQSIPNLEFIKSFDGRTDAIRVVSTEPHPKSITPPPHDVSSGGGTTINSSNSDIGAQSPSDSDDGSEFEDDAFLSDCELGGSSSLSVRLFQPKPRPPVQRRATIPGATARPNLSYDQMLQGFCPNQYFPPICSRDASSSSFIRPKEPPLGGDISPRPHTCIGTEKEIPCDPLQDKDLPFIDEADEKDKESGMPDPSWDDGDRGYPSPRETPPHLSSRGEGCPHSRGLLSCPSVSVVEVEEDGGCKESVQFASPPSSPVDGPHEGRGGARKISEDRPKLDKSYSSPTYDDSDEPPDFFSKNTLEVAPPKPTKPSSSSQKEGEALPEEKDFNPPETAEPPRKKIQTSPPKLSKRSPVLEPDFLLKGNFSLAQDNIATSLGPLASLALSTIPISAVPASVSAFDQVYGMSKDASGHLAPREENALRTNTITVQIPSCDTPCDTSSYVAMNGIDELQESSLLSSPRKSDTVNPSTNLVRCSDAAPKDKPDAQSHDSASLSGVSLREAQPKSPLAWRRGLVLTGAGNRRISCRDLGQCDHHGWLYRRKESKGFLMSHRWEKRWFVLKKSDLYGYRDKDSTKADSYIYMPGFYVCPASDIKSKRFAFKIYHSSGATFYFACDTAEERSRWMSQMGLSAISKTGFPPKCSPGTPGALDAASEEAYYSETDDELEEKSPLPSRAHLSSASKESLSSLLKGSPHSSSPMIHSPPLGSSTVAKSPGIRFLQSSKPSLGQPVPTSNFRSYVRVRDTNPPRSTSISDLLASENSPQQAKETPKSGKPVRRKGSLRERLRQIPASLTLDRKRSQQKLVPDDGGESAFSGTLTPNAASKSLYTTSKSETSLLEKNHLLDESRKAAKLTVSSSQLPNYMRPTRSSSQNLARGGHEPDPSSRRSPLPAGGGGVGGSSSVHGSSRRGSLSGMSSSNASSGSLSPRRGSLDCLSQAQAASPPTTPMKGFATTAGGRLAVQREYQEGSPEKMWISSLRSDGHRSRSSLAQGPRPLAAEKKGGAKSTSSRSLAAAGAEKEGERLKRTSDYHAMDLKGKGESMQPAFEMTLADPKSTPPKILVDKACLKPEGGKKAARATPTKPQVPPRTKFLSPSERVLSPNQRHLSPGTAEPPSDKVGGQNDQTTRISRSKAPPNLTLSPASEDSDGPKTPLKPTMGIAMIGKQRRTPVGTLSPREILPHYPGTEYPPTFEPESYSINLSSDFAGVSQVRQGRSSPQPTPRASPQPNQTVMSPSFRHTSEIRHFVSRSPVQSQIQLSRSASSLQTYPSPPPPLNQVSPHIKSSSGYQNVADRKSPGPSKYPTLPKRSPRSPQSAAAALRQQPLRLSPQPNYPPGRQAAQPVGSLSPVKEATPFDEPPRTSNSPAGHANAAAAGYVNISHVSSTLDEFNGKSYHHNIYVTSPCSQGPSQRVRPQSSSLQNGANLAPRSSEEAPQLASGSSPSTAGGCAAGPSEPATEFQTNAYLPMDKVKLQLYMNVASNQCLDVNESKKERPEMFDL